MLDPRDLTATATRFGVSEEQVRRDHLIAHVLAALAELQLPDLVFLGGTALSWTHLPDGRQSEDIDLMTNDRGATAAAVEERIPRLLRSEFPGAAWDPGLRAVRGAAHARLTTLDGLVVRIQLLDTERQGWHEIPTTSERLVNRYRDVPATTMLVPTLAGFAAMKTLAWTDRRTARDPYDLAGLAALECLDTVRGSYAASLGWS